MSFSEDRMDFEWEHSRAPVFDERFAPDEYDPLQRNPRGYTAGRGCVTHGHPEPVRRRRGRDVQAPVRAGVDPVRARYQNPFAPREPVQVDGTVPNAEEEEVVITLDCKRAARRMKRVVVERVLDVVQSPIDCPICFEGVENPFILGCGHVVCQECLTELLAHGGVKCPHCRGKIDLAKVMDKDSFLKVHGPSSS